MATSHYDLNDEQFETGFAKCEISPSIFNHEAHVRLAWIHIRKYGIEQAVENMTAQLRAFVEHVGAEGKYNHTVTIAATRAVYHFMLRSDSADFKEFIMTFPQLKERMKELLESHYSMDIFTSEKAKNAYLEPDLAAFD